MSQENGLKRRHTAHRFEALLFGAALILSVLAAPGAAAPAASALAAPAVSRNVSAADLQLGGFEKRRYIVALKEQPLATYEGDVPGYAATAPDPGRKIDAGSPAAQRYSMMLEQRQRDVAGARGVEVRKQLTAAVNAFTADLTGPEAAALAKDPGVLSVTENVQFAPHAVAPDGPAAPDGGREAPPEGEEPAVRDYSSTDFLNLRGEDGVWEEQFGGVEGAGKGVVVGVIDTGYAPNNAFLAGAPVQPLFGEPEMGVPYLNDAGQIVMLKADGNTFIGECQAGEGFDGSGCNSKVLSARYFADQFVQLTPEELRAPQELLSPVDVVGHGTHTATTAAGNSDVRTIVGERDFGFGSGVAPAAKVAVYKICWEDLNPNAGNCSSVAAVEAVNQAVLDGVDVLNYSVSGTMNSVTDPLSLAFRSAASAGIFVAVSAGNSGPLPSTVNHAAPWVTTVAASTFSNELMGTVLLPDGSRFRGASIMDEAVPQTPVVLAENAGMPGVAPAGAALCPAGALDPAIVLGKIVICDRGISPRVAKSDEVQRAGGIGMILTNVSPSSTDVDQHAIPTVHLDAADGLRLKAALVAAPAPTAALEIGDTTGLPTIPVPQVAGFSSRGPSLAENADLLKPDLSAPGVAILAGVSPIGSEGEMSGFQSGTSMASPHVAGFGALLLSRNPLWSAAVVKSAMMTTATDVVLPDGARDTDLFATGAGHIDTERMLDPGLAYEADPQDWQRLIASPPEERNIAARDVNLPSIAVGELVGQVTVARTVTALEPGEYHAEIQVPGIDATVSPSSLVFDQPGQSQVFQVTFENAGAAIDQFTTGSLVWSGEGTSVVSPVAVRPVTAIAPDSVSFTSATDSGSGVIPVTVGTSAPIPLTVQGLTRTTPQDVSLVPGPVALETNPSNHVTQVEVPAGTSLAQFAVTSADPTADFDLYVLSPAGPMQAATPAASESLTINDPVPGTYLVVANLFASPGGAATAATVETVVLAGDEGNLTLSPNPLVRRNGESAEVTASWTGLEPGNYIGMVTFGETGPRTAVNVAVGDPAGEPPAGGAPAGPAG